MAGLSTLTPDSSLFTQNLSSVLADPSKSRSENVAFFTRHWGETYISNTKVPPCNLPPIRLDVLLEYRRTILKAFRKMKDADNEYLRQLKERGSSASSNEADDLPTIFADPNFVLSDADTFRAIFVKPADPSKDALQVPGRKEEEDPDPGWRGQAWTGELRSNKWLHAKLDAFHDIVDGRLAARLVEKTDDFWNLVASHSKLNDKLATALVECRSLRKNLAKLDSEVCETTERLTQLYRMREKKEQLVVKLKEMACVREAQATVQLLLSQGEFSQALECIETAQKVLDEELSGVTCFRHLGTQLGEVREVISRVLKEDFTQLIQKELAPRTEDADVVANEAGLSSVVAGLVRVREFSVLNRLTMEISDALRAIVRLVVKNRIVDSGIDLKGFDPALTQLRDTVRQFRFVDWMATLEDVMAAFSTFIRRVESLQELMQDMTARHGDHKPREASPGISSDTPLPIPQDYVDSDDDSRRGTSPTPTVSTTKDFELSDAQARLSRLCRTSDQFAQALGALTEFAYISAQERMRRLLEARSKDSTFENVKTVEFVAVVRKVQEWQTKEGAARGQDKKQIGPLATCLTQQTVDYIKAFHEQRKAKIMDVFKVELWRAADVPVVFQRLVDTCETNNELILPNEEEGEEKNNDEKASSATCLVVQGEQFIVVGSALLLLRVLAEYCTALKLLPAAHAPDLLVRVVELLTIFNSLSCQLVLGAGALNLVGLRSISVRNLSLSSRSLQLIARFVPVIATQFESLLPDANSTQNRHFKKVLSDYGNHVNEIDAKLVSVIDNIIVNCLNTWEVRGSVPSAAFQQICKHIAKFHQGMMPIMPRQQIRNVIAAVNNNFKAHLRERTTRMKLSPQDALAYGLVAQDYSYYMESIRRLEGCADIYMESLNDLLI